jgi:dihydroorotate dehydrogenase
MQVGTALFIDPFTPVKIVNEMKTYLKKKKISAARDLVGKVRKY